MSTLETFNTLIIPYYKPVMMPMYLYLVIKSFAASSSDVEQNVVRRSVIDIKCFIRPMKVRWSHRGAFTSNLADPAAVLISPLVVIIAAITRSHHSNESDTVLLKHEKNDNLVLCMFTTPGGVTCL